MSSYVKIGIDEIKLMSEMRHSTALVWMRLLIYGGANGRAWPKQDVIRDELGLSKTAVSRAYSDLKKMGLLRIQERRAYSMCVHVRRVPQKENCQNGRVSQKDNTDMSKRVTESTPKRQERVPQKDNAIVIDNGIDNGINKVIGSDETRTNNNNNNNICSERANKFAFTEEKHLWVQAFISKWKTKQWLSNNMRDDIKQICWSASPLQTQKAIHKMDVWMSKQKSADVWSGRSWYRRMALWVHEEPEVITERDRYRMRGSTIKIDSPAKEESTEPAPIPEKKVMTANTRARKIWSEFLKHDDYEKRYHAVQSWIGGGVLDDQLRKQIEADKELEEFAFMIG